MNLRNLDNTPVENLKDGSHKHILFDCDVCGDTVEQSYRNYLNQKDGKFCRKCRNKHTANREDVKQKQSKSTKERWKDNDYREIVSKSLSISCKKSWEGGRKKKNMETDKNTIILNEIEQHLKDNNIEYTKEDTIFYLNEGKVQLEYIDSNKYKMKIPKFNIEGVDKDYFYKKSKEALDSGSFKYFIKDFEWHNENKREIMKSQVLHLTNKTPYRFFARNTEVKVFSNRDVKTFEVENCFYGYRSSSLNLGLVLKKEMYGFPVGTLLMAMTFGLNFFAKKSDYVEVFRAGTLRKCQVIGGASKLFKYFVDNYPTIRISNKENFYNRIVYYVDLDHGAGKSVGSMGFEWVRDTKGGFMNVEKDTGIVSHRKPMHHMQVMEQIKEGKVLSVPNSGVKVYEYVIDEDVREKLMIEKEEKEKEEKQLPIKTFFS
jgi:hypothetical protein